MYRILNTGNELASEHRGDFETCPHCNKKQSCDTWMKTAHTLVLRPSIFRSGNCSIHSECPSCFESSWIHYELDSLDYHDVPRSWVDAVQKESARQKLSALRQWGQALCWQCQKLRSATIKHDTYRYCEDENFSGSGLTKTSCDKFLRVDKS